MAAQNIQDLINSIASKVAGLTSGGSSAQSQAANTNPHVGRINDSLYNFAPGSIFGSAFGSSSNSSESSGQNQFTKANAQPVIPTLESFLQNSSSNISSNKDDNTTDQSDNSNYTEAGSYNFKQPSIPSATDLNSIFVDPYSGTTSLKAFKLPSIPSNPDTNSAFVDPYSGMTSLETFKLPSIPSDPSYDVSYVDPYSGTTSLEEFNQTFAPNASTGQSTDQSNDSVPKQTGSYGFNEATDLYNQHRAEEDPEHQSKTWFEYQTDADARESWDLLTSDEFSDVLSDEFKNDVLYDFDTFEKWFNQEKANNTVDKMVGPDATENVYDYIEGSNLDELTDWIIANKLINPNDIGIFSSNGYVMPNDPLFESALAYNYLIQAAKYNPYIAIDDYNTQVGLVNPRFVGTLVDREKLDADAEKAGDMAAYTAFGEAFGKPRDEARDLAKQKKMEDVYEYDPDADFGNLALRATLVRDPNNTEQMFNTFQSAKQMPAFEEVYNEAPAYFDTFNEVSPYLSDDESYNSYKAQVDKELEKAIGTWAYNQGYYYRGGK